MKDRVSTEVLANGALRYGIYNANGSLNRYEYIKPEDAPVEAGDTLNKANILPDDVVALLGITVPNPQIKDALAQGGLVPDNYCLVTLSAVGYAGCVLTISPDPGIPAAARTVPTSGVLKLYVPTAASYTVSIPTPAYADLVAPTPVAFSALPGTRTTATLTCVQVNALTILTSQSLAFSPGVAQIDVFCVGGGGKGGTGNSGTGDKGGGGGGGYTQTKLNAPFTPGTSYTATVGAGGTSGAGGTTSLLTCSAAGGAKGTDGGGYVPGPGGNGGSGGGTGSDTGAAGASDGASASPGGTGQGTTTKAFGEVGGTLYSGGGGGGTGSLTNTTGGSGGGGAGAAYGKASSAGTTNTGGGGGGGSATNIAAGAGGSGIILVRIRRA